MNEISALLADKYNLLQAVIIQNSYFFNNFETDYEKLQFIPFIINIFNEKNHPLTFAFYSFIPLFAAGNQ